MVCVRAPTRGYWPASGLLEGAAEPLTDEVVLDEAVLDGAVPDGLLTGDLGGEVVPVGDGDLLGCGGLVGCGFSVGEPDDGELEDDELELDDALGEDVDDAVAGDVPGPLFLGPLSAVVEFRSWMAPGSTRGSAAGSVDPAPDAAGRTVVLVALPGATGVDPDLVLTGPAAPEPKSALRCTKPISRATWAMPGTPLTAAATPEIDRIPTVTAPSTPTRPRVCRVRA